MTIKKQIFREHNIINPGGTSANFNVSGTGSFTYAATGVWTDVQQDIKKLLSAVGGKVPVASQVYVMMDFGLDIPISDRLQQGDQILSVKYHIWPDRTDSSLFPTDFALLEPDGFWNSRGKPTGPIWTPHNQPPTELYCVIQNTIATDIVDVTGAITTSSTWFLRQSISPGTGEPPHLGGWLEQVGQTVTIPSSPGTLSNISIRARKSAGTPSGNCRIQVYDVAEDDGTNDRPIGNPIATSDNVANTSLPTGTGTATTFNFTGGNQIDLSSYANTRLCIVFESDDYESNITNIVGAVGTTVAQSVNYDEGSMQVYGGSKDGGIGTITYSLRQQFPFLRESADGDGDNFNNHGNVELITFPAITNGVQLTLDLPITPFQQWVDDPRFPTGMDTLVLIFNGDLTRTPTGTKGWGTNVQNQLVTRSDQLEITWRARNRVFIT